MNQIIIDKLGMLLKICQTPNIGFYFLMALKCLKFEQVYKFYFFFTLFKTLGRYYIFLVMWKGPCRRLHYNLF